MSGDFSFLKGNINTIILCSLYGRDGKSGDKYGYEIAKEIKERTESKYEIKQPTLYAYLKKLENQDLIKSYWGTESNGGRRRYYTLTQKGRNDCENFMAEWEYHKTVLSTLVDSSDMPLELEQKDVTPLFGDKHKRQRVTNKKQLDEQDEISRRLDELIGAKPESSQPEEEQEQQQIVAKDYETEESVENLREEVVETAAVTPQYVQENNLANFEVNQDDADDFMQEFEERARVVSESLTQTESSENYQHILEKMIGDQLDEMKEYDGQSEEAQKYYTEHPAALEEVADSLAEQGIRMRIYRHTSALFKSKTLIPLASVLCKAAWVTFAVAFVYFGILLFTSISTNNWQPFLITLSCVLLLPIAFTIYALYDPSRKEKPRFMFGRFLIAAGTMALIIILLALGISILNKIELHDFASVSVQILIPTGIAILLPVYILVFNMFYKKY